MQNIYRDDSIVFDRKNSFVLTKEIVCDGFYRSWLEHPYCFILLQVGNTFWLFLFEITAKRECGLYKIEKYSVKLLNTWKNYNKPRVLISTKIITFGYNSDLIADRYRIDDEASIIKRLPTLIEMIDTNDFQVRWNFHNSDEIPLLKACGIGSCIDPLDIYLAFEEYFSLEKSSQERIESIGITDKEKVENHGFDVKSSFRGKR